MPSQKHELEFSDHARENIREIAVWYFEQKPGLDDEFLLGLEATVNSITSNPLLYQIRFNTIRSVFLKRFPYPLFYSIEQEKIIVLGIYYTGRNPKVIAKRIQKK